MKIGIVTTWFPRGAAYVSKAYLETLSSEHKVFVYARGGERYAKGNPEWDKNYVTWGKRSIGKDGTYIDWEEFRGWIARNGINLLLFNEQNSWEIVLKVAKLPILVGSYIDYYTAQTVPFFRMYDFLFCNTRRHYRAFRDHPGAFYIPWGTDVDLFKPPEKPGPVTAVTFLHAAGMSPLRKGTDLLVEAFLRVKGTAKLVVRVQTPAAFKKCAFIPVRIAQDSRIELIQEEADDPALLYRAGDVYVYPSRLDGLGLTVTEALAAGLPVIATDAEPMNDFITHDQNGKLVAVETTEEKPENYYWPRSNCSVDSLREAMQFFVDNPDRIKGFQAAARTSAEEKFDWKKNSGGLPKLVAQLKRAGTRNDVQLISDVMRYERAKYRNPLFLKRMEAALKRLRRKR